MTRVAIVTDSASDLDPAAAVELGISIVPLVVNFGSETFRTGVDLSRDEFWRRMTAPDAPFPTTAASSPGEFKAVYDAAFAEGAEAIVSVHVSDKLSGTIKSAQIARDMLPDREIHIVDSSSVSMAESILAEIGVGMAAAGASATDIVAALNARRSDIVVMLAMDTLEYLKRGGRISGARAAIGTILSVKPVIEVKDGVVETVDRPRTRAKARERLIELVCARPIERLSVLHSTNADVESFRDAIVARVPGGIDPSKVSVDLISASVGPHVGPGSVGAIALYKAS